MNDFFSEQIAGFLQYERDMYTISKDYESTLFKEIFEIIEKSFTIDKKPLK